MWTFLKNNELMVEKKEEKKEEVDKKNRTGKTRICLTSWEINRKCLCYEKGEIRCFIVFEETRKEGKLVER